MEPLSTLALVAAFLAPVPITRRPDWSIKSPVMSDLVSKATYNETWSSALVKTSETEDLLVDMSEYTYVDRRDLLTKELDEFCTLRDGWDHEDSLAAASASIAAARKFLEIFPGGLPLPRPMLSSKGEAGFYWDLDGGFADLSFDTNGTASFFSRSHEGIENFQEALSVEDLNRNWSFNALGYLAAPKLVAA